MRATAAGAAFTRDPKRVRFPFTDAHNGAERHRHGATKPLGHNRPDRGADRRVDARSRVSSHHRR